MLRSLFQGIKDLIYPDCCLACGKKIPPGAPRGSLCAQCWGRIEKNLPPFCVSCGRRIDRPSAAKNVCSHCLKANFNFDRAFSPCVYTGAIKKLIHEFKYSGKDYLGKPLGKLMNEFIRDYRLPVEYIDFVIPVPLHKSRMREREFNQAQLLGEQVCVEFGLKMLTGAMKRSRPTRTQTELSFEERRRNVENSFTVNDPEKVRGANILLVDDVLTTGSTSSEAAGALKAAGAGVIFVLTLAN
jgi:ComF family protein